MKKYTLTDAYKIKRALESSDEKKDTTFFYKRDIHLEKDDVSYIVSSCKDNDLYDLTKIKNYLEKLNGEKIVPTLKDIEDILKEIEYQHAINKGAFITFEKLYSSSLKLINKQGLDYEEKIDNHNYSKQMHIRVNESIKTLKKEDANIKKVISQIQNMIDELYIDEENIRTKMVFEKPIIDKVEYQHIQQVKKTQQEDKEKGMFDLEPSLDASLLSDEDILLLDPVSYIEYEYFIEQLVLDSKKRESKRADDLINNLNCLDMKNMLNDYIIRILTDYYKVYEFENKSCDKLNEKLYAYRKNKLLIHSEYASLRGKLGAEMKNIGKVLADELSYYIDKSEKLKENVGYGR